MGFSRRFTGGFEDVADARRFVAAALLRDTELYEAARLLVDEAITNPLLHSEACATARSFRVTITFRPDLLHVEVHDGGPRNHSTAETPDPPRWPAAASSCSTPGPRLGLLPRAGPPVPRVWFTLES